MMMTKSAAGKALKYLSLFPIAYLSLLAGASIVHNMYKPDLVRPFLCVLLSVSYYCAVCMRAPEGLDNHS